MTLRHYRLILLSILMMASSKAMTQYSMTETGITITFDGVNFGAVDPITGSPAATQLSSLNWAVDLDNDNDFDMNGTNGFSSLGSYDESQNITQDQPTPSQWDEYADEDDIFSFNYDLGGLNADFPGIGMAVVPNFGTNSDALITKIENTGAVEYLDLEISLDAFYYYDYEEFSGGVGEASITIEYFLSATDITTNLGAATWTELDELTNNNETTDGWKQFTGTTFNINAISMDVGDFLYLKFVFNPNNGGNYEQDEALAIDNISVTPMGFGGTDATTTLAIDESGSSTTVSPTSSSAEIFRFDIVDDGAADGYPTTFSELVISSGASNTVTDWTTLFESVTLTDETGGGSTTATIGASTLTFSSLTFASATDMGFVTDATSKEYSLTIDFVDTYAGSQNVNNEVLQFLIQSSDIEIEGLSSTFQTANSVETTATNNVVSVTADRLELQDEPSVVGTGNTSDVYFGFTVRAVDAAGHLDTDVSSTVTITESTQVLNSGGILTFSSGSASSSFANGAYDYTDLFFNTSGSYTISLSSGGFTDANFGVTAATSWRSTTDGDWGNSTGTVWQYFVDGVGWTTAAANEHPNATAASVGPIYINNTVAIETTGYNSDQLIIESGGTLDVNNTFTINEDGTSSSRDLTIRDGGTLDVEAAVTITGTFLVESGSSLTGGGLITSSNGTYVLDFGTSTNGYWQTNGVLRYTTNATITPGGNLTFFPNAATDAYPVLDISALTSNANISDGANNITINGILYYTGPGTIVVNSDTYTVRNGVVSDGQVIATNLATLSGDTVFWSGNIGRYNDLDYTFTSGGSEVLTLLGNVTSGSNNLGFTFGSGTTLDVDEYTFQAEDIVTSSGATIKVAAATGFDLDQFGAVTNLTLNSGTIFHFDGTATQDTGFGTLDGGTTSITDMVIDNAAGVSNNSDLTISSSLTFNQGILTAASSSPGVLTMSSTASFSGFSAAAHIQGPVSFESFASSKFIPIGAQNGGTDYYRPVIVDPVSSTTVITEYTRSDPNVDISNTFDTDGTDNPEALTTSGYFTITFGATGTADIALFFDDTEDAIAGSTDLVVAKYDNSAGEWVGYASTAFGADYLLATVTIDDVADVYFTVASTTTSLLPVELIDFKATTDGQQVSLNWSTASELTNDRFEVEQSTDGLDFRKIGQVEGNGTTNETQRYSFIHSSPFYGTNYYRLKQVDFDGGFEYSPTVRVSMNPLGSSLQLLQNPTESRKLRFVYTARDLPQVSVYDEAGVKYAAIGTTTDSGVYELDLTALPTGRYLLVVDDQIERFIVAE